jgi:dolichol-phosphate mannosyltransferase
MVSGSRYLSNRDKAGQAPAERRQINTEVTRELNQRLGLQLTDGFCGFKAYRVDALAKLRITEPGYGMPLEVWVQAAYHKLRIVELPVPLIYLDEARSFGGSLDDGGRRMAYYHQVLDRAIEAAEREVSAAGDQVSDDTDTRHPTPDTSPTRPTEVGCSCD